MKYLAYSLALIGWLGSAIIFRYGLYPPQVMFWLVSSVLTFIAAGLAQDKWAGIKISSLVWLCIPVVQQIYPGKLPQVFWLLIFLFINLIIVGIIGFLASKIHPKFLTKFLVVITLLMTITISGLYVSIEKTGNNIMVDKSDAAIILGAAVWEGGRPSPSMYARVKEGVKLYQRGLVAKLIVTGGLGRIPPTEAEVMAKLAKSLGVREKDILLEKEATSTRENLLYSKKIGDQQGFNSYILVTDAFHLKRALLIANSLGLTKVQGIPALESPLYTNKWLRFKYTLRETFALIKYYVYELG